MKLLIIYLRYLWVRIFYISVIALTLSAGLFFARSSFDAGSLNIRNPLYAAIRELPFWLYAVDFFIFIFMVAIFILMVLIGFYSITTREREKTDDKYRNQIVSSFFRLIYSDEILPEKYKKKQLSRFKRMIRGEYAIRVFLNTLIKTHEGTTGVIRERIVLLFGKFKYNYFIYAYLHSPNVSHKILALKAIATFQLHGYEKKILKLARSKNDVLHFEAIVTLLKLKFYEDLSFIFYLKNKITVWDINIIVKTVLELNTRNINYQRLIESDVPEIVVLGIMLSRVHGKKEYKQQIRQKVMHPNELVREEAFLALISFIEKQDDYRFLMENFETATEQAQLKIIRSLESSKDKAAVERFLTGIVETKVYTHKIEAIRLLLDLNLNVISGYKKSENYLVRQSCLEVLDINL